MGRWGQAITAGFLAVLAAAPAFAVCPIGLKPLRTAQMVFGRNIGDERGQRKRGDLQPVIPERFDGATHIAERPALEQLVANSQSNHAR